MTFASSRGASTSSNTQIGDGLVKKTAKINESAVSACSPPDNKVIDGDAYQEDSPTSLVLPLVDHQHLLIQVWRFHH